MPELGLLPAVDTTATPLDFSKGLMVWLVAKCNPRVRDGELVLFEVGDRGGQRLSLLVLADDTVTVRAVNTSSRVTQTKPVPAAFIFEKFRALTFGLAMRSSGLRLELRSSGKVVASEAAGVGWGTLLEGKSTLGASLESDRHSPLSMAESGIASPWPSDDEMTKMQAYFVNRYGDLT